MTTVLPPNPTDADIARKQYFLALQMALTDFQFIEEALRLYILASYELIQSKLKGRLPFHFDYSDVENDALGRLVQKFSKFSDNQKLVQDIRAVLKDRNSIAHRGLLLTVDEQGDVAHLDRQTKRLESLHAQLKPIIQELLNEGARVSGTTPVVLSSNQPLHPDALTRAGERQR